MPKSHSLQRLGVGSHCVCYGITGVLETSLHIESTDSTMNSNQQKN